MVLAVELVDLIACYSIDSNMLHFVVLEELCLQCSFEAAGAENWVSEMIERAVPGHWTGHRERSTI